MEIVNRHPNKMRAFEILVEPISQKFVELHNLGKMIPKRGFNLRHEKSLSDKDSFFICLLLGVNEDMDYGGLHSFLLGVIDTEETPLNVEIGETFELWEGRTKVGDVRVLSISVCYI